MTTPSSRQRAGLSHLMAAVMLLIQAITAAVMGSVFLAITFAVGAVIAKLHRKMENLDKCLPSDS